MATEATPDQIRQMIRHNLERTEVQLNDARSSIGFLVDGSSLLSNDRRHQEALERLHAAVELLFALVESTTAPTPPQPAA